MAPHVTSTTITKAFILSLASINRYKEAETVCMLLKMISYVSKYIKSTVTKMHII